MLNQCRPRPDVMLRLLMLLMLVETGELLMIRDRYFVDQVVDSSVLIIPVTYSRVARDGLFERRRGAAVALGGGLVAFARPFQR
jgi:hypothetical protein